eukprot:NODE_57_length_28844_cov_0.352687.p23 type:complete len:125 gc:universal NODE_57_length_28844_cov_0.352687:751-377(-)
MSNGRNEHIYSVYSSVNFKCDSKKSMTLYKFKVLLRSIKSNYRQWQCYLIICVLKYYETLNFSIFQSIHIANHQNIVICKFGSTSGFSLLRTGITCCTFALFGTRLTNRFLLFLANISNFFILF